MKGRSESTRSRVRRCTRISLAVLSPGVHRCGALGILEYGGLRSAGQVVTDPAERVLAGIFFIILGVLTGLVRFDLLRRRDATDAV